MQSMEIASIIESLLYLLCTCFVGNCLAQNIQQKVCARLMETFIAAKEIKVRYAQCSVSVFLQKFFIVVGRLKVGIFCPAVWS